MGTDTANNLFGYSQSNSNIALPKLRFAARPLVMVYINLFTRRPIPVLSHIRIRRHYTV
ncbi:hypothetical protein TRIATDRAFT_302667 [Trichoderma atroviride IMI 206040]|uniref:Uncharacterized protein n=1 Tax=Hypocrea atroviridis (strain ATCC 20476 / IMI 206040) TaxID=452589 RepID=G9P9C8_HYPAI|nr:uncharacterized protein TRIATDRAFT_302667 [Trichoderma atroviride IMI 206040]EHK40258.1 hypothetical protein TRIATDRAFT_302667 [Trichoderma atroviride IMI 206040]